VSQLTVAYLLMLLAFLCFAGMDTTAKWLVGAAVPVFQVVWLRYFGHFLCTVAVYMPKHGIGIVKSNKPGLQFMRAMFLLCSTALNFSALKYLPLTTTIAIFFVAPLTVCLLSIPILGEKVGVKRLLAVGTGFVGVLVIVEPWGLRFDLHVFLSIGAMLCASGYFVMSRVIAGVDENSTVQFYVSGIATLLLAPFAFYVWQWPDSLHTWFLLTIIGTLGMIGHSVLTHAHQMAEASVLAPTVYSQIIYIAIFSWMVFGQPPDLPTIIGTAIIVSSGLFIWYRERQNEKRDPLT
jgi:drug/metabolite transporter (DMT)-like permease